MARTSMPELTRERLTARFSVLMLTAENGSESAVKQLEASFWTLNALGIDPPLIARIQEEAAKTADLPNTTDYTGGVAAQASKASKKQRNGAASATADAT